MRLLQPPGKRSTCDGAERWGIPPTVCIGPEVTAFIDQLPLTIRSTTRLAIRDKMQQGLEGELSFCTCTRNFRCTSSTHDVKQSESRPRVLELRWDEATDEDDERLGITARLYLTEPEHVDELTYLLFRAKYPRRADWREQQTQDMAEADDVITNHFDHQ